MRPTRHVLAGTGMLRLGCHGIIAPDRAMACLGRADGAWLWRRDED